MCRILKSPEPLAGVGETNSLFLAGSIEMGLAEDWQTEFGRGFEDVDENQVTILNPRRDDWDSSWQQTKSNSLSGGRETLTSYVNATTSKWLRLWRSSSRNRAFGWDVVDLGKNQTIAMEIALDGRAN